MSQTIYTLKTLSDAQKLSIGVLGDGQLAQMMSEAATSLGLNFHVFASHKDNPAAQVSSQVTLGVLDKTSDFLNFCENKDLITIESEFIDPQLLKQTPTKVWPAPETLECLRDRLPQKKSLIDSQIPTSPLHLFTSFTETALKLEHNPQGLVFKKRLFGYDGYGTRVIRSPQDLETFKAELLHTQAQASKTISSGLDESDLDASHLSEDHLGEVHKDEAFLASVIQEWIAEDFIAFSKELAISFARNPAGQILSFPLVESHQKDSKCLWVKGPVDEAPYQDTIEKLKAYINKINFVGLISFELFLTRDGQILINEVAPRVHNSAHYSIEALNISQFTAHLMAICNMELPSRSTLRQEAFAMYNLIGERDIPASELSRPQELGPNVHLHWYQKTQSRKGRKMGHLTTLADTPEKALLELESIRVKFKL